VKTRYRRKTANPWSNGGGKSGTDNQVLC